MLGYYQFRKFLRYFFLYGFKLTIVKTISRFHLKLRVYFFLNFFSIKLFSKKKITVGIIGCGNHSFTSIAYFLYQNKNVNLSWCFDINYEKSVFLSKHYNIKNIIEDINDKKINNLIKQTDIVYIASNHSTHAKYLSFFNNYDCKIFIEKPLITNWNDLEILKEIKTTKKLYTGYNRPNSSYLEKLFNIIKKEKAIKPFNLSFFIIGHRLESDHWYNNSNEGTRICGNICHWIDLSLIFINLNNIKNNFINISISYSNKDMPDENIIINLRSSKGDLINILFSIKEDPIEGVTEYLVYHNENLIVNIDNYKKMIIKNGAKIIKYNTFFKDSGHKKTINFPLMDKPSFSLEHNILSSKLILFISDMIKNKKEFGKFDIV